MADKIKSTHVLIDRALIVYRRERSDVWQCRYKVDGKWQRTSTHERDLEAAKVKAHELRMEAEIRKRQNLPVITRKFRDVAKLANQRMQDEIANGSGKVSYADYIYVIDNYLIPCLGKRNITSIDHSALDELDAWRILKMGKEPSKSTILTHNTALNRVFDEAVIRNFLTEANRMKLEAKGRKSERRPAFELKEVQALLAGFDGWIERGVNDASKERRALMRDYVMALLDTGARPGKELLQLKWKQIKEAIKPVVEMSAEVDEDGDPIIHPNLNRSVEMVVTGKTGTRTIVGMTRTVNALREIAKRNYDVEMPTLTPLKNVIKPTNNDYVFRTKKKIDPSSSFNHMFDSYLTEHNLLTDPKSEQKRTFYSLRHTYATLMLQHDGTNPHTLAKQMGTSILMLEKHYSHLKVVQAIEQLRGEESRQLINAGGEIDAMYMSNKAPKAKKAVKIS